MIFSSHAASRDVPEAEVLMSFEGVSKVSARDGGSMFSVAVLLGACLLVSACVAAKPIDGDPRCPCAPGWICSTETQTCVKAPDLERGGHNGGGGIGGSLSGSGGIGGSGIG